MYQTIYSSAVVNEIDVSSYIYGELQDSGEKYGGNEQAENGTSGEVDKYFIIKDNNRSSGAEDLLNLTQNLPWYY